MKTTVFLLIFSAITFSVSANPGQYQINQACIDVGCFSGDNPATTTIEISQSAGTFVLTSNLTMSDSDNGSPMILVSSPTNNSAIVIDLNGFQIKHNGIASSTTNGIVIEGKNSVVTVKNGKIAAFHDGINSVLGSTVLVENIVFRINRDDAIQLNRGHIKNSVFANNKYGVFVQTGPNGPGDEQLGERVYIDSNLFLDPSGTQDALTSVTSTSYCKDNVLAYDDATGLGACTLSGDNQCDDMVCAANNLQKESKE